MTFRSTDRCPNCDSYIESDYCYNCGYTTKEYNYLADRLFMEEEYERESRIEKAKNAIKIIFNKRCFIQGDRVHLPISFIDADRTQIRKKINKINLRYGTHYDTWIERYNFGKLQYI